MERLTDKRMKGEGFISADPKEYKAFIRNEKPTGKQIYQRLLETEEILGDNYDLDHMRELVETDRDGRCVFTKCKLGDVVFIVGKKKIVKARVQEIYIDDMPELIYLVDFECDNCCDGCPFNSWSQSWEGEWECSGEYGDGSIKQSDFGKTVFITREAAEAALEGENKK